MNSIIQQLRPLEQAVVAPLEAIDPAIVNATLREQEDSAVLAIASVTGQHCALEIVFGRLEFANQLSIFLGEGAEFCNAEPFATHEEALALAEDVRQLASSPILSDEELRDGAVSRATYLVQLQDRNVIRLTYRAPKGAVGLVENRSIRYSPWLSQALIT